MAPPREVTRPKGVPEVQVALLGQAETEVMQACGKETTMNTVNGVDWPHGLRCMDCDTDLDDGDPYSERLTAFIDETPAVQIVCLSCAVP